MRTTWRDIADRIDGKAPKGSKRSGRWRTVRQEFLKGKVCAVCGGRSHLVAHHVIPFHVAPDLELDPSNLLPLCESGRYGINCHFLLGHLGNWQRANVIVRADVEFWRIRLRGDT